MKHKRTLTACCGGIFTQAIITNITAILFVPMMSLYGFDYRHLGLLVAINFISQVIADIIFSGLIDRLGYRKIVQPACATATIMLVLFSLIPYIFPKEHIFLGISIITFIFAFSSGLLEIILSPIVDGVSDEDGGAAMSFMHSFYAWGQVATIIITTLLLHWWGKEYWHFTVLIWAAVPLATFFVFRKSFLPDTLPENMRVSILKQIRKPFFIVAMLAIFFGAGAEVTMNQYASAFMEKGLNLPKLTGDLLGMTGYAVMLGLGRLMYGFWGSKLNINKIIILTSFGAFLCYLIVALSPITAISVAGCVACGFATSLLWPGTLVVTSNKYPMSGAWIFAILAVAGDIGAASLPYLTGASIDSVMNSTFIGKFAQMLGATTEQAALRFGLLVSAVFPVFCMICHVYLKRKKNKD